MFSTNPLFMTNRDDALTPIGMAQVEEVCNKMLSLDINPSVVKYSLASKCLDTVNIIANTMMIGRNRIVPEFTFMVSSMMADLTLGFIILLTSSQHL